jgi:dihydroflavonol-4-reductase
VDKTPGKIVWFKADLLKPNSYDEAFQDVQVVIHTASPFKLDIKDPQKELVDPALLGTRNVLNSSNKSPSVKKVVLTSSCAAIYGDNQDLQEIPDGTITEEHWNTSSDLSHQP